MKQRVYILIFLLFSAVAIASARPRLAVNIVVCGLRQSDLSRYEKNFSKDGFLRLRSEGAEFTECYADYAPTTSEAGLATFATGAIPAVHGIFSSIGFDRTTKSKIELCSKNLPEQSGSIKDVNDRLTSRPLVTQTLSEVVLASSERNRSITIAHNHLSAMILAGRKGECYWIDKSGKWSTAECYAEALPQWVRSCNSDNLNRVFATDTWYGRYTRDHYYNTRVTDITIYEKNKSKQPRTSRKVSEGWVENLRSMPSGNLAIFEFAKRAVASMLPLRSDDECKMLNICLDVPRAIAERYGADSIEYEDMLYSLDASLAEFMTFLYAQLSSRNDIVVVLTSDGGVSPTCISNGDSSRFNSRQFEVIMNAFLSARYGQDSWILGYTDGSLYLNHDVIYRHKLSVTDVQNDVANFALQYRGVSTAVTATALRSAQFSRGAMLMLQNGYHPRRSGDVMVVLDSERIEMDSNRVAMSGSIYNYDRHIPLIINGAEVAPQQLSQRITNDQIAPTLATMLGVDKPYSSDAEILDIQQKNK